MFDSQEFKMNFWDKFNVEKKGLGLVSVLLNLPLKNVIRKISVNIIGTLLSVYFGIMIRQRYMKTTESKGWYDIQ